MNIKKVYDYLPIPAQNVALSIYGLLLKRLRHGASYKDILNNIDLTKTPKEKNLESNIIDFISEAMEYVPAYQALSHDYNSIVDSNNVELSSLISNFPIVSKDELRGDPYLYVPTREHGKIIKNHTSGSTGSPLEILTTKYALQFNYAFFHKFLAEIGVSEFERSATFAGRMIVPRHQRSPIFWRKNYGMNTLLLSSYHISKKSAKRYLDALEAWKPIYIDSYPSAIYELASFLRELNLKPALNLKAIVTSSETLFKYQREVIEETFECPIYDQYGCAEQAVVAFQIEGHQYSPYLVPAQYSLVEVLNDSGDPVSPGEEGRLICTNLFNKAMPLIRYDIGDLAVLKEYYPGTTFARSLASISGRVDDVIKTKDGVKVGRLDPVFKGLKGIKEAQIVQQSLELIEIRLVPIRGLDIDEQKLIELIKERVGEAFSIKITYYDSIPRNASGKFRSVISNV